MKRSINEKVKLDTSEKLKKTPRKDRNKIVYRFYNEKGTEIIEIRPGEDGVTEIDLQNFYSAEDHEIYENLKARRPELTKEERLEIQKFRKQFISKYTKKYSRTPLPVEVEDAVRNHFSRPWTMSTDELISGTDSGDTGAGEAASFMIDPDTISEEEPDEITRLHEIISSFPESWQEIYQMKVFEGRTNVDIAERRGVSEGAIRKTWGKITRKIESDEILKKLFKRGTNQD